MINNENNDNLINGLNNILRGNEERNNRNEDCNNNNDTENGSKEMYGRNTTVENYRNFNEKYEKDGNFEKIEEVLDSHSNFRQNLEKDHIKLLNESFAGLELKK